MPASDDRSRRRPCGGADLSATVDVPARSRNSKAVGAVLDYAIPTSIRRARPAGGISRCGDEMMPAMLYEAAQVMLTLTDKWSWLKAWAMKIPRHRGMKKGSLRWNAGWPWSCTAFRLTAPSSAGPGTP